MNKTVEILLTALVLSGMYCAIPKSAASNNSVNQKEEAVIIADGSDPMPLCRRAQCGPHK
jgi:hypothetical protein